MFYGAPTEIEFGAF